MVLLVAPQHTGTYMVAYCRECGDDMNVVVPASVSDTTCASCARDLGWETRTQPTVDNGAV